MAVAALGTVAGLTSSQAPAAWLGAAVVAVGVIVLLAFILEAVLGGPRTPEPELGAAQPGEPAKSTRPVTRWVARYFTVVAVLLILAILIGALSFVKVVHEDEATYGSWLEFTSGQTQSEWVNTSGYGQMVFNWTQVTAPGASPPQVQVQVTGPGHQLVYSGYTNYGYPGNGGIVVVQGGYLFNVTTNPSVDTKVYLQVQAVAFTYSPLLQF